MKKLFLIALVLIISVLGINNVKAQINLNINIGSQPLWGPTGYNHAEYYYLPDIDVYYYVPSGQYIYLNNGQWVWNNSLPIRYRNFDLYRAYKVVLNTRTPYLQHNQQIKAYAKYKNYNGQQTIIRDSRDNRYNVVKGHQYNKENKDHSVKKPVGRPEQSRHQNNNRGNENQHGRPQNNNRPQRG